MNASSESGLCATVIFIDECTGREVGRKGRTGPRYCVQRGAMTAMPCMTCAR